jgi:hypothetical protein
VSDILIDRAYFIAETFINALINSLRSHRKFEGCICFPLGTATLAQLAAPEVLHRLQAQQVGKHLSARLLYVTETYNKAVNQWDCSKVLKVTSSVFD